MAARSARGGNARARERGGGRVAAASTREQGGGGGCARPRARRARCRSREQGRASAIQRREVSMAEVEREGGITYVSVSVSSPKPQAPSKPQVPGLLIIASTTFKYILLSQHSSLALWDYLSYTLYPHILPFPSIAWS